MKKKFIILLACIITICTLALTACDNKNNGTAFPNVNEMTNNLEFWIAENVDDVDFSDYQIKYGMFGGTEYYGKGYVPTVDKDGQQADPEHCVIYTVTPYPDYMSKTLHVTHISITDPAIEVGGLTINSTKEEVRYQMQEKNGFSIEDWGENTLLTRKGNYTFSFSPDTITISVNVTNKEGIVF